MIRVTCPKCQSRLNAKEELAGQKRKCPKCGTPITIPQANPADEQVSDLDEPTPDQHVEIIEEEPLPGIPSPERLGRFNRYLICDKVKIIATWQNNGHGWMLRVSHGNISATRNCDKLPAQGNYTLVELQLVMSDHGLQLVGLHSYRLADRWALTTLDQGDHRILERIVGPGCLAKETKAAVRKFLIEELMRDVWQNAQEVMDYLSNADYHSPGVTPDSGPPTSSA